MKNAKLSFYPLLVMIIFLFCTTGCSLVDFEKPGEVKNEMLEGEWDPISYRLNGQDYSSILSDITFIFTPSEAFPKEGKYETFKKNKRESIEEYEISEDGNYLLLEELKYAFDVSSKTLILTANDPIEHIESVELILIRK